MIGMPRRSETSALYPKLVPRSVRMTRAESGPPIRKRAPSAPISTLRSWNVFRTDELRSGRREGDRPLRRRPAQLRDVGDDEADDLRDADELDREHARVVAVHLDRHVRAVG